MNFVPSAKYGLEPDKIEKKSLESEEFRDWFDIRRLTKVSKAKPRYERHERHKYLQKRKKLRVSLEIGEDVLLLASRTKKKSDPGQFYKSSVDNKSFFDKKAIFTITDRRAIGGNKTFYWIKNKENNKKVKFQVMREEIFALSGNFM